MMQAIKKWFECFFVMSATQRAQVDQYETFIDIERSQAEYWNTKLYGDDAKNSPLYDHYVRTAAASAQSKAATTILEFRLGKISKLNEEIKNLQLSIVIAKKQKKRTSDMYREMARIQAEILKLEAM